LHDEYNSLKTKYGEDIIGHPQSEIDTSVAKKKLAFENNEKEKQAAEFIIANKELAFQNNEKDKRAAKLILANKKLVFQNAEKQKRAAELILDSKELDFQICEFKYLKHVNDITYNKCYATIYYKGDSIFVKIS